jgi:hypothetical protein
MVGYLLSWHYSGGLIFERIVPDMFDVIGAVVACAGVGVIYYAPRRREEKLTNGHQETWAILITNKKSSRFLQVLKYYLLSGRGSSFLKSSFTYNWKSELGTEKRRDVNVYNGVMR